MNYSPHYLGRYGEQLARRYYEQKGHVFYDAHIRRRFAEIDLVMIYKTEVHFIEVKTRLYQNRSDHVFYQPEHAVTRSKRTKIRRLAEDYLLEDSFLFQSIETTHIDIASITILKHPFSVSIKIIPDIS